VTAEMMKNSRISRVFVLVNRYGVLEEGHLHKPARIVLKESAIAAPYVTYSICLLNTCQSNTLTRKGGNFMPTYRIIINGEPTGDSVTGVSYVDAYFSASNSLPAAYKNDFKLEVIEPDV
jgi:hypothetical protein